MSNLLHSNRQLLWSILRASNQSPAQQTAFQSCRIRFFASTPLRLSPTGHSVSFGDPEIDKMIAKKAENQVSSSEKSSKSRKTKKHSEPLRNRDESSAVTTISPKVRGIDEYVSQEQVGETATIESSNMTKHDHDAVPIQTQQTTKSAAMENHKANKPERLIHEISIEGTALPKRRREEWQIQKDALKKKFGEEGWNPRKKLSPDAIMGIRNLHDEDPNKYSTPVLASQFKVSPEAIRRILKSRWRPSDEEMTQRRERWAKRYDRLWDQKAELGLRPPRRRDKAADSAEEFEERMHAHRILEQYRNA